MLHYYHSLCNHLLYTFKCYFLINSYLLTSKTQAQAHAPTQNFLPNFQKIKLKKALFPWLIFKKIWLLFSIYTA